MTNPYQATGAFNAQTETRADAPSHAAPHEPTGTLVVPTIITENEKGRYSQDIYSSLLDQRIVMIDGPVDDHLASIVTAQLLYLEAQDPNKDIHLYINSPGGSVTAGMKIYDVMRHINCDVSTIGAGLCASMGSFLLAAGAKGKRFALPNTEIMTHQPSAGTQGKVSDMERMVDLFKRTKYRMKQLYMKFLDLDSDDFEKLYDRDTFFNSLAAKKLGHVDEVLIRDPSNNSISDYDKELFALEMEINQHEIDNDPELKDIIERREQRLAAPQNAPAAANDTGSRPAP